MTKFIKIRGARQNNLKGIDLDLPAGKIIAVTGVSGSGKSSLVFDTLYAEGQRRYVETFSSYARQFLDRMDRPEMDGISGIPPAIAIHQVNSVKTSRSTVGTMTELSDYWKLLYARHATLHCRSCAEPVSCDDVSGVCEDLRDAEWNRVVISAPVDVPDNFSEQEVRGYLAAQGYDRVSELDGKLTVIIDRFNVSTVDSVRFSEAVEAAFRVGSGTCYAAKYEANEQVGEKKIYTNKFHCANCDISYSHPTPGLFSFNSPIGACPTCRGFGRVIGVDMDAVIANANLTLEEGVIKPWQTDSYSISQKDLMEYAAKEGIPTAIPWRALTAEQKEWVLEGDREWVSWKKSWPGRWYGVRRFFGWLETKSYKMHIRVLLSKYRSYSECPDCAGSRLKSEALLWRLGDKSQFYKSSATGVFKHPQTLWSEKQLCLVSGLSVHDLNSTPILELKKVVDANFKVWTNDGTEQSSKVVIDQIISRLNFLQEVGLGYLTLDRQSRTLSGGETQRLNLATALGASLTQTLFLLDEPSIGLHPKDLRSIVRVIDRLKNNGNTIVVVEHDPQIIWASDYLLDIGPGAGENGGHIEYFGRTSAITKDAGLTSRYLLNLESVRDVLDGQPITNKTEWLTVLGAKQHNLKNVDVSIPMGHLVSITGVSGSGKSTLLENTIYDGIKRIIAGKPISEDLLKGFENVGSIQDVIILDQRPIGKSSRSNPVSYIGALSGIRELFANSPDAKDSGFTKSHFSFNSGYGRCQSCQGSGFELVEMQFLSDVYIRCSDCNGRRYRSEILDVRIDLADGKKVNIDDVLNLTVEEACQAFEQVPKVKLKLRPLIDVGLGYLRLGQPVPTLSGGEAQRLKLASYIADASTGSAKNTLFLLDEPTTGLHFDDVKKLLVALRTLVSFGASVVVVEHNLDLIMASDWIIDMGPEGGEQGGRVISTGAVAEVINDERSVTGQELKKYKSVSTKHCAACDVSSVDEISESLPIGIVINNARENNLKNVSVEIPHGQLTIVSGLSGSGKSSLAFDIVFGEGQRRYLESLNAYARQYIQVGKKPDVDAVFGIPPSVAIEQRISRGGIKSTVGTVTETYHYLRLLMSKVGIQYCPDCNVRIESQSLDVIVDRIVKDYDGCHIGLFSPLVRARKGIYADLARSFNKRNYPYLLVDGEFMPTDNFPRLDRYVEHTIELPVADFKVSKGCGSQLRDLVEAALTIGDGFFNVINGVDKILEGGDFMQQSFSTKYACPSCRNAFDNLDPRLFSFNSKYGWCEVCHGTGRFDIRSESPVKSLKDEIEVEADRAQTTTMSGEGVCQECNGYRLNRRALSVYWSGYSISDLVSLPIEALAELIPAIELVGRDKAIAEAPINELLSRLRFLSDVGLSYLDLNRSVPTLSGGEAQRMRLSAQLGSSLTGAVYVLDEPTIGLHPRDNQILLRALKSLQKKGNTLLIVEHDEDTINEADFIIDLGPGSGVEGGRIIAQGSPQQIKENTLSITGRYLNAPVQYLPNPDRRISGSTNFIEIIGANRNNLKSIDVRIPLSSLTVITGVSGSGKSSLVRGVLLENLTRSLGEPYRDMIQFTDCNTMFGSDFVKRVIEVDQSPIGRTSRSCPATYTGIWEDIRKLFAATTESRVRGYTAARFSFNTAGGRCASCEGQGIRKVEMNFLPDVRAICDVCNGSRFDQETQQIFYNDQSVSDVLRLTIKKALELFSAHPKISRKLKLLNDLGLGYLTLGQHSSTLSGGEAQRVKLVSELSKFESETRNRVNTNNQLSTLFLLDEPTVGLHMADVEKLVATINKLVEKGATVVIIEHNTDVIRSADWVIDLGPNGGEHGGSVLYQGPVDGLKSQIDSATGMVLSKFLSDNTQ